MLSIFVSHIVSKLINHHGYDEVLILRKGVPFLEAVIKVIKYGSERQYYDNSDPMTDYFDTAFYLDVEMGYQLLFVSSGLHQSQLLDVLNAHTHPR